MLINQDLFLFFPELIQCRGICRTSLTYLVRPSEYIGPILQLALAGLQSNMAIVEPGLIR